MTEWDLPTSVEKQTIERVGGGGYAWESGVYEVTCKMVYLNQSAGGAVSFNVVLENPSGKELKESFWIKSGNAKGNKTYYTREGKDYPLPGYSVANSMCVALTGDSLAKCMESAEKKTIKIYSAADGKEMPTERPVLMDLLNKAGKVAVHQLTENKSVKNDAGVYVPTADTRTVNECKFFGNAEGSTAEELTDGKAPAMFDAWAAKNTGVVIDKTSKKEATASSAASIMGGAAATPAADASSLFG